MPHPVLRSAAPLGAAVLAAAALAAPASSAAGGAGGGGGGGGGGVAAAGGEIVYNTASITLSGYPTGAVPITVTRDGATIATGTANVDGTGLANLNVNGIAAPEPLDCWTGFTPEILPGDRIVIGGATGATVDVPDFSVERPTQIGGELVVHGTAATVGGAPMTGVEGD